MFTETQWLCDIPYDCGWFQYKKLDLRQYSIYFVLVNVPHERNVPESFNDLEVMAHAALTWAYS